MYSVKSNLASIHIYFGWKLGHRVNLPGICFSFDWKLGHLYFAWKLGHRVNLPGIYFSFDWKLGHRIYIPGIYYELQWQSHQNSQDSKERCWPWRMWKIGYSGNSKICLNILWGFSAGWRGMFYQWNPSCTFFGLTNRLDAISTAFIVGFGWVFHFHRCSNEALVPQLTLEMNLLPKLLSTMQLPNHESTNQNLLFVRI